ncbi:MAG: hypothetical protein ACK5X5_06190, partial [bacterium]
MPRLKPADPARLGLAPHLRAILDQPFPRFSDAEMQRRRHALADVMRKHDVDQVLVCGELRAGPGISWLSGWVTASEQISVVEGRE